MATNGNGTKSFQTKVITVVGAIIVLAFVYGLLIGMIPVPPEVATGFWGLVGVLIVLAGFGAQAWYTARQARLTREEVAKGAARVEDGLGQKMADLVKVDADKTAAAMVATLAAADAQKAIDDAAQKQRDDVAALTAKLDALMLVLTPPAPAPGTPAPAALVAPNGVPIATDLQDNTAAQIENTISTDKNTEGRIAALEDIVKPPEEV